MHRHNSDFVRFTLTTSQQFLKTQHNLLCGMRIRITEKTKEDIENKLKTIITNLSKLAYLESAVKEDFDLETKRFIWLKIAQLHEEGKMYEKAAKAVSARASIGFTFREKCDAYIHAAELFAKAGKLEETEEMFVRAARDATLEQKQTLKMAFKNIFLANAKALEREGKNISALKFYEKLIKMNLEDIEKQAIKQKLISNYKALGRYHDAKLIEGL